jgi:hypothetical protein
VQETLGAFGRKLQTRTSSFVSASAQPSAQWRRQDVLDDVAFQWNAGVLLDVLLCG